MIERSPARLSAIAVAAFLASGCSLTMAPPRAGDSRGAVPALAGAPVMVLPVQSKVGIAGDAEAEMVFALQQRGPRVKWVMPATLRAQLQRNPSLDVPVDDLPVRVFLQAQVNRVGDPLFGYLQRMAAVSGARIALVPVQVRARPATKDRSGAVEYVVSLLNVVDGRVMWFGIVEGEAGDGSNAAALATAADALARILLSTSE